MSQNPLQIPDDEPNPFARPEVISQSTAANPYAPTSLVSDTDGLESDVEAFRNRYLAHEASIKSIGFLYMIPGVLMLAGFVMILGAAAFGAVAGRGPVGAPEMAIVSLVYGGFGALSCYAGWGIRKFQKGPKMIVTILSAIGLLGIPFGTIINGYILYLLHSEKGKVVFSDRYQEVIRQTPHIKYKTSLIVKIFVGLLIVVLALGIISFVAVG